MRRATVLLAVTATVVGITAAPVPAITYGQPDGNGHPNVGAVIAEWRTPGVKEQLCSGTLIDTKVFLTAAHCTAFLESQGIPTDQIWVSFAQDVDPVDAKTLIQGTWVTNPRYSHRQSDPGDLAVILLKKPGPSAPASLPTAGLFDEMARRNGLKGQTFTAVGYGVHEPQVGGGPPSFPYDGERWRSVSEFSALNDAWLRLSQNDATSDGGTCFGDSGGPNFLGSGSSETDVVASVTVTGDAMCLATNTTLRLDTASARRFLGDYVALP